MQTIKILRPRNYCSGGDRVLIEEIDYQTDKVDNDGDIWSCDQALVTFFSLQEVLDKYKNYYFDTYGNLVLKNENEDLIDQLAPTFFSYLGNKMHLNNGCGFTSKKTFVKEFHGITEVNND